MDKAGMIDGRHYTTFVDEVHQLKRTNPTAAEELLYRLVVATESEAAATGHGVAPWYYQQLAILYAKRKDFAAEVAILERFAAMRHAPGAQPPKLLARLEKARVKLRGG